MKLFSWMQRKPQQTTDYSLVSFKDALDVKNESETVGNETETLLSHILDGILTIGTLGHNNPLLSPIPEEPHESVPEVDLEAHQSLAATPEATEPVLIISHSQKEKAVELVPIVEIQPPCCEITEPLLIKEIDQCKRTTLADLFEADEAKAKTIKVLLPAEVKGRRQQPAIGKKLQRLMTKMLKKKIHPDIGQVKTGASDCRDAEAAEQCGFSPKGLKATMACACYGVNFSEVDLDQHMEVI